MISVNTKYGPIRGFEVVSKNRFKVNKMSSKISVVRNPRERNEFAQDDRTQLLNPISNNFDFGYLRCPLNKDMLPIHFFVGFHNSPINGYGLKHIWKNHSDHLIAKGFLNMDQIGRFLADFFKKQPSVFQENDDGLTVRVSVVDEVMGTVILEARQQYGRPCWSVITAHQGIANHGDFIGTVKSS